MDKKEEILQYWFGPIGENALPSEARTSLWFDADPAVDNEIKEKFYPDLTKAATEEYADWENTPRGCLALIILLDQFSRHIYRHHSQAFSQDQLALSLCLHGIDKKYDHQLSLLERVFFYLPLMHAENLETQTIAVRAYQMLENLSFPEVQPIFQQFLEYANMHYAIIKQFDRFPHRNEALGRESTPEEVEFIKTKHFSFF